MGGDSASSHAAHEKRQQRAHLDAAQTHDRAAEMHRRAADLFDQHDRPSLAIQEREIANAEDRRAAEDRERAARRTESEDAAGPAE